MQCLDFERILNEQIDAREDASGEIDRALEAHASVCPACRLTASRYQTLRNVIRVLELAPTPPIDFVDRFFESREPVAVTRPGVLRFRRAIVPLALAASLLLMACVAWLGSRNTASLPRELPATDLAHKEDPYSLADALADAGSATWELARETSAPAARVGREVFVSATFSESTVPAPEAGVINPASEVLQNVGDRVNAGVRPLSGTARHAFGFLLGAPSEEATRPSSAHGA